MKINLNKLFSIKKDNLHYVINLFGLKCKIKDQKKAKQEFINMKMQLKRLQIPSIYATELNTQQKVWFLSNKFYEEVGYFPNLKNPRSFNEKINWLKLNYYNPIEDLCIDKYSMKKYIDAKLGKDYVVPAIGIYDDVNDIDFENLPNRFVMKVTTSGSGEGVEIIKEKNKINIDKLKYKFNDLLQEWNSIYYYCLSRGYKNIQPRILIEEYITQSNNQLYDYKFMCFNGEPKWVLACSNRGKNTIYENHDMNWDLFIPSPRSATKTVINRPKNFNKMVEIAKELAAPFPFVRVDFYETNDKVYVGELTFTPAGGFNTYSKEWDYKVGEWLDLTKIDQEYLNVVYK